MPSNELNTPVPLQLRKREERRLLAGHLWVYSNEVDTAKTPFSGFEPGQMVQVLSSSGRVLGYGTVNPHSLICTRLLTHGAQPGEDSVWLRARIERALALRDRLYPEPWYRLIHGEGDGLPGLVVDRYGDYLVVQITTSGMEARLDAVLDALESQLRPKAMLLRNDGSMRALEGLESYVRALGPMPERLLVREGGVEFEVAPEQGQKTGWFYDQCDNRARVARYAKDARVLDVFSYVGAWGVRAACQGAREVVCVDASQHAADQVLDNAARNQVGACVSSRVGDAFELLREMRDAGEQFDLVILDPPAFIKRKKDHKAGIEAYQRLNQLAMQLLTSDATLISASCSYHLAPEQLQRAVAQAGRRTRRDVQILERGRQGPDHPVHPAIAETEYLKALYCRVTLA